MFDQVVVGGIRDQSSRPRRDRLGVRSLSVLENSEGRFGRIQTVDQLDDRSWSWLATDEGYSPWAMFVSGLVHGIP